MTRADQLNVLEHAAELLTAAPWHWTVTVEYPGYLLIWVMADDDADDIDKRGYAAGFANTTLTVDQTTADGNPTAVAVDTKVPCDELNGYRMAVHVAAAIDRMEHE
jgi:hypothetical protein